MKKSLLFLSGFAVMAAGTYAQQERSVFSATGRAGVSTTFATDYQAIGINPSNLGWKPKYEGRHVSFSLAEGAYSIFSEALEKPELRESVKSLFKGSDDEFTYEEQVEAAKDFTSSGVSVNADINWVGLAIQTNKFGGIALGVRDRFQWYSKFNDLTSDILFLGYNADYFDQKILESGDTVDVNDPNYHPDSVKKAISSLPSLFSQVLDGSRITMAWTREYNLAYGIKLLSLKKEGEEKDFLSLFGGVGIKYMEGIAIMEVSAEDGKLEAFSAISPAFNINYGSAADINPSAMEQDSGKFFPQSVGSGFGFDIGFSAMINEKLKLGLAITDIGSVTWTGNVYVAHDTLLHDISSGGFESYNFFEQAQTLLSDSGLFTWDGIVEKKVNLPTVVRLGGSYAITENLEVGIDMAMPANKVSGNLENPLVAAGIDILAFPWLRLSTGIIAGGNYGFNLPAGLVVIMGEGGTWEMGVASRDILTYFLKSSPTLSMSFGLLRFRL